jgi:hypothetical protein
VLAQSSVCGLGVLEDRRGEELAHDALVPKPAGPAVLGVERVMVREPGDQRKHLPRLRARESSSFFRMRRKSSAGRSSSSRGNADPMLIADIRVLETIREGVTVYKSK